MIFDHYDRVRIVNLPERTDRRRDMEREFRKIGMGDSKKVEYFRAIRMTEPGPFRRVGSHGNFLGQLQILEEALAAGESVVILEDDCRFQPAIHDFEPAPDTDILYGGYSGASDLEDLENATIIGSHFMGFSLRAIEKLVPFLRSLLDTSTEIDPKIVRSDFDPAIRPPIDGSYVWFRRYHPELKTEFADLAHQRPSATDVGQRKWFDRMPVIRDLANLFRRFM